MKKPPKGLMAERTLRSMLKVIAMELRKEMAVETKLELLNHQARLSNQLRKVAIVKDRQPA